MVKIAQIILILLPILAWTDFPFYCSTKDWLGDTATQKVVDPQAKEQDSLRFCGFLSPFKSTPQSLPDPLHWYGGL